MANGEWEEVEALSQAAMPIKLNGAASCQFAAPVVVWHSLVLHAANGKEKGIF